MGDLENCHRSIYLLPNIFTTASLFAGFYAIVQSMNNNFEISAIAIFVAMILDGVDGRIARFTNTQSSFGEHYDSLSDMVSFGVAPALVIYEWILHEIGRWGWIAAFVYVVGAALRLARFNTNINNIDKVFFQGLPTPAAAALVSGFIWLSVDNEVFINDSYVIVAAFILTMYSGILMVTNIPFYSGKNFSLRKSVPFWVILLMVGIFVFVSSNPPLILFCVFIIYGLSGWIISMHRYYRAYSIRKNRHKN
ncbi:MAG: CDP-diacylglycerol--serine O-phosphatidyltransferase [Candidatus Kinetoplastibacterium crithidii]|nr:MAG: CDP-diacylglycerol--serine O-phosphatidyltransferase [Candidatus Kinetoplastibacterium crithidii]